MVSLQSPLLLFSPRPSGSEVGGISPETGNKRCCVVENKQLKYLAKHGAMPPKTICLR